MTEYLIRLYPLEPYTFGQETGFQYGDEKGFGKQSYIMESGEVPDQTALFGITRYLTLYSEGLLRTDFRYKDEEMSNITESVGEESFSFEDRPQSFGKVKGISPVFLMDEENHVLVTNPFHNQVGIEKDEDDPATKAARPYQTGFQPVKMQEKAYVTSCGEIHLPAKKEYQAKHGYGRGFYDLFTGQIQRDLFSHSLYTGIRKSASGADMEDAFFKLDRVTLKEGYCFAFFAEMDCALPKEAFVYLGKKKNAFKALCIPAAESDAKGEEAVREQIQQAFSSEINDWYYAWSDINISDIQELKGMDFCMKEEKQLRNLQSSVSGGLAKIRKSMVRVNLIKRGSVFYRMAPQIKLDNKAGVIGMNRIIKLSAKGE